MPSRAVVSPNEFNIGTVGTRVHDREAAGLRATPPTMRWASLSHDHSRAGYGWFRERSDHIIAPTIRARAISTSGVDSWIVVVEFLTFVVDSPDQDRWLVVEEREWSRFLSTRQGFVRKEMWRSHEDPTTIHAVIWWESLETWEAVTPAAVESVDRGMGRWLRKAAGVGFDVIRER